MLQNQSTVEPSLDLILVSRHLERIGDHATNIAEDVIFMVSALDVRHHLARAVPSGRVNSRPNPNAQRPIPNAHSRTPTASR